LEKFGVNSNRLNQLWPNNNSSIQIWTKWDIETSGQIGRVSITTAQIKIGPTETTSSKFG